MSKKKEVDDFLNGKPEAFQLYISFLQEGILVSW